MTAHTTTTGDRPAEAPWPIDRFTAAGDLVPARLPEDKS
jgi:hypothetical protein